MENELQETPSLTKREKRELAKQEKQTEKLKNENTKKLKDWGIRIVAVLLLAFGGYKVWQWINTPQPDGQENGILAVRGDDWVKGGNDAKVTLIEYADFECPACAIYSTEVIKKLTDEFGANLRVVYRHFPLPQHKTAVDAAKAAEAAGVQGKFWEMHDLLYLNQADWSRGSANDKFRQYAQSLGLDMTKYDADFGSEIVSQSIKNDESDGYALRINATPTFYVNGKVVNMKSGLDDLKKAVEEALGNNK